jgi:hypothetical protein
MPSVLYALSFDSGTPVQNAALLAEVETALGWADDPLVILLILEEEFEQSDISSD